MNHRTEVTVDL